MTCKNCGKQSDDMRLFHNKNEHLCEKSCEYDCTGLCTECSAILCNFQNFEYRCEVLRNSDNIKRGILAEEVMLKSLFNADFNKRSLGAKNTWNFIKTKQKGGSHAL